MIDYHVTLDINSELRATNLACISKNMIDF